MTFQEKADAEINFWFHRSDIGFVCWMLLPADSNYRLPVLAVSILSFAMALAWTYMKHKE